MSTDRRESASSPKKIAIGSPQTYGLDLGGVPAPGQSGQTRRLKTDKWNDGPGRDSGAATEKHFSVREIAERWGLSVNAIRRLFQNEPGVLALGEPRPKFGRRRGKVTLRIPQSVLERVYSRQCIGA